MILRVQNREFEIPKRRKVTHETFTMRYKLDDLENKLARARRDLEQLPAGHRRRQREKIWRIEQQIDVLRLRVLSDG